MRLLRKYLRRPGRAGAIAVAAAQPARNPGPAPPAEEIPDPPKVPGAATGPDTRGEWSEWFASLDEAYRIGRDSTFYMQAWRTSSLRSATRTWT